MIEKVTILKFVYVTYTANKILFEDIGFLFILCSWEIVIDSVV